MSPVLMSREWLLPDVEATQRLGASLARSLNWSERDARVVFLCGELGAGKTTLTAAALAAIGVTETVRSPSFSLIELYETTGGQAVHMDLYRLTDPAELEHLGLRDHLRGGTLLMIEWPERGAGWLPLPDLRVELLTVPQRSARIEAVTPAGRAWLERMA